MGRKFESYLGSTSGDDLVVSFFYAACFAFMFYIAKSLIGITSD